MGKWHSAEEKQRIVNRYILGKESVLEISSSENIPQSTIYDWLRQSSYRNESNDVACRYSKSTEQKKIERYKNIIKILKTVNCTSSSPLREKLYEMEKLYPQYNIHILCDAMDVSRGTFYNHLLRNKKENTKYAERRAHLRKEISSVFEESEQRYGPRKITAVLQERGTHTTEKTVRTLMREMDLYSICQSTKCQYNKEKWREVPRNILKRDFNPLEPDTAWVSDVTYFKCTNRTYYICVVLDLFSRKVLAYKLSLKNSTELASSTFQLAYTLRNPKAGLIFHTDRGTSYTSKRFNERLRKNDVVHSYSQPGTPYDNAVIESFFKTLKTEELYRVHYRSEKDLKESLAEYIRFYNSERPHGTLNNKAPDKYEENYRIMNPKS